MSRAALTMSHTEFERLEVILRVRERRLTQEEAAGWRRCDLLFSVTARAPGVCLF